MTREKRRAPRVQPFVLPCRVDHGDRRSTGYLADLGPLGARVVCREPPPAVDAALVLEVRFGRGRSWSRLSARTRWIKAGEQGFLFGITFERLGEEETRALQGALEEFRKRAAEI